MALDSTPELQESRVRCLEGVGIGQSRAAAPHGLPLALRTATRQRVTAGRFPPPIFKPLALVKWVIEGEAVIGVEGRRLRFRRGDVAIHLPSIPHQFWATSDECELCWFSVHGPVVREFSLALGLQPGTYSYGEPPVEQIDEMIESLRDYTIPGHRRASLLAIRMLYDIADRISTSQVPSVVQQAQQFIHAEFADPELSVDRIASRLNYHRGSLSRVFHKHAGMTIVDYVSQVRLQHARTLLMHTEDRVGDIAVKCGFREANYFCRWLHKHTGLTPSKLRRETEAIDG